MPTLREGMAPGEKTMPAVIDYIHANPVRRRLVEHPTDWPWSSARFWEAWPLTLRVPRRGTDREAIPERCSARRVKGWPNVPIRMDDPVA